jgi:hypothetical protein
MLAIEKISALSQELAELLAVAVVLAGTKGPRSHH